MTIELFVDYAQGYGNPYSAKCKETQVSFKSYVGAHLIETNRLNDYFMATTPKLLTIASDNQKVARNQFNWVYYHQSLLGAAIELRARFYDSTGVQMSISGSTGDVYGHDIATASPNSEVVEIGVGLPQMEAVLGVLGAPPSFVDDVVAYDITVVRLPLIQSETLRFEVVDECIENIVFLSTLGTYTSICTRPVFEKANANTKEFIDIQSTTYSSINDRAPEIIDSSQRLNYTLYLKKDWYTESMINQLFDAKDVLWYYNDKLVRVQPQTTEATYFNDLNLVEIPYLIRIESPLEAVQSADTATGGVPDDPTGGGTVVGGN